MPMTTAVARAAMTAPDMRLAFCVRMGAAYWRCYQRRKWIGSSTPPGASPWTRHSCSWHVHEPKVVVAGQVDGEQAGEADHDDDEVASWEVSMVTGRQTCSSTHLGGARTSWARQVLRSLLLNRLLLSITLATFLSSSGCGVLNNRMTIDAGDVIHHGQGHRPSAVHVTEALGIISRGSTPIFC